MALPAGVATVTVNIGPEGDFLGDAVGATVTFTPSRSIVWSATGTEVLARPLSVVLDEAGTGAIVLPATDQAGFTDGAGHSVTGWTYRVAVVFADRSVQQQKAFSIQLPAAAPSVDLGLLTPVASSAGVVVSLPVVSSINGQTGAVVIDAGTFGFGTAASHAATDFDTAGAASGAQAAAATDATNKVAAEATARAAAITALNLGTASTHPVTDFASPSAGNRPPPRLRLSSVVSTFDAGHGWTSTGWATSADDTTSGALASQSLKGTTTINVACVWEKTGLTLDTTGKDFVVWVNAAGLAPNVSGIRFQAFAGAGLTDYYEWYLVHNESITWQQVGEWCRYTLSFHDATPFGSPTRSNIQRLRWRIGDKNNVPLTLSVGGVALASQSTAFPNGVVSITTDDGHLSQYTTMRPIFNRYGFPATCYTIASRVDNPSFPTNMTSAQLRELERLDGWEIAGHAYDTANHDVTGGYSTLSLTNLRAELANLRAWLVSNNYRGRDHIAYPQGN